MYGSYRAAFAGYAFRAGYRFSGVRGGPIKKGSRGRKPRPVRRSSLRRVPEPTTFTDAKPMLTSFLLGTTLAAGQAPAPMPMPIPAAAPAAVHVHQAAPMPVAIPVAVEAAPAEAAPEAKKYLVEKLLEGSTFGQILADRGITIQGWTQGNYTLSNTRRSNAPTTFNDRADFFMMNQNWLDVSKSIDTSKDEFQFGWRSALILPGYDYKYTLARGFWNDQSGQYGFDAVYHYGEFFAPESASASATKSSTPSTRRSSAVPTTSNTTRSPTPGPKRPRKSVTMSRFTTASSRVRTSGSTRPRPPATSVGSSGPRPTARPASPRTSSTPARVTTPAKTSSTSTPTTC
jgi:hypothetical protein